MDATLPSELLVLAQKVTNNFVNNFVNLPNLDAILVTGSVAKGFTDSVSDIDLMFYYAQLPSPEEFERLKQEALANDGGIYSYNPEEGLACYHFVEGVKVDFAHQSTAEIDTRVNEFLTNATVEDEITHIMMSGITQGILLYGGQRVRRWQNQLAELPETYITDLIDKNLRFPPTAVMMEMGIARQDFALVYELMLASLPRMLNIWCGLNERIPPGKVKRSDHLAAMLRIVPDNASERLRQMWSTHPQQGVIIFYELVHETLALVQLHRPDIDIAPVRQRLQLPLQKRSVKSSDF